VYLLADGGVELYLAHCGRFNVEGNFGWVDIDAMTKGVRSETPSELSHSQMQTLLGSIGAAKGYDIWIPTYDQPKLDWTLTKVFEYRNVRPLGFQSINMFSKRLTLSGFGRDQASQRRFLRSSIKVRESHTARKVS